MKNVIIAASITLFTVSCLSQQPPAEPKAPKQPTAAATIPVRPVKPAPAGLRAAKDQQDIEQNIERGAEDLIAKMDFLIADPFSEHDNANRTLAIPRDPSEAKNQADTEEDLNVMAHILEKASVSRDERNARSVGIFFRSPFGSSPSLRNLYLEGYGAVFFLNVNYSLTPLPSKSDDTDGKEEAISEWDEARRELTRPRGSGTTYAPHAKPVGPAPEYDADKVENLKKSLSQALKNAAHIRKLKSDESVTVVVTGRSGLAMNLPKVKNGKYAPSNTGVSEDKLIIRAKKSDIEAFQNEKIAFEDFRKKVAIFLD